MAAAIMGFMGPTEHVLQGNEASEHFVQLCDSSESMAACAASFLADAHAAGNTLLIVARDSTWIRIHHILTARGIDVGAETLAGRLIAMDATAKLAEVSQRGILHAPSFELAIADPVRTLAAKGRLSIYAEMVDVLAQLDEIDAAVALEEMWNSLAERASFHLMCAYSSGHFVSRRAELRLRDVCGAHTHVRSHESDVLGGWLLKRSQLGLTSGFPQVSAS